MKNFIPIVFGGALVIAAFLFVNPGTAGDGSFGALNGKMTCTETSVNATTTAGGTAVLAQSGARAYAKITNDQNAKVYYSRGTVARTTSTPIQAGEYIEWGDDQFPYWGPITVLSSSGTSPISVIDCKTSNIF